MYAPKMIKGNHSNITFNCYIQLISTTITNVGEYQIIGPVNNYTKQFMLVAEYKSTIIIICNSYTTQSHKYKNIMAT